jgi:hypothetical protein
MRTTSGPEARPDEVIRAELIDRLRVVPGAGPRLRAEIDHGRADLYLEPEDAHAAHELLTAAVAVAGVTSVHLYCGQAHR